MSPILTDAEIDEICAGLEMPSAKVRYLRAMGLLVGQKPNRRPLVARSEWERVRGAARFGQEAHDPASGGANILAMRQRVAQGRKHGQKA